MARGSEKASEVLAGNRIIVDLEAVRNGVWKRQSRIRYSRG